MLAVGLSVVFANQERLLDQDVPPQGPKAGHIRAGKDNVFIWYLPQANSRPCQFICAADETCSGLTLT